MASKTDRQKTNPGSMAARESSVIHEQRSIWRNSKVSMIQFVTLTNARRPGQFMRSPIDHLGLSCRDSHTPLESGMRFAGQLEGMSGCHSGGLVLRIGQKLAIRTKSPFTSAVSLSGRASVPPAITPAAYAILLEKTANPNHTPVLALD